VSYAIVSVLGATEAAETAEIVNPILPVPNEMFWGAVFFFVLWALMKWVFLPPVQRTMQRRADVMRSDREAADTATTLAAEEAANYEQSLASARAEAVRLIEQARGEAEQERRVVVGAAETEAAAMRAAAAAEIAEAKVAAMSQMREGVGSVAVSAASAVVNRDLDPAAQQSLVQQYLDQANSAN
jgi:F-type H+-transporting ATPase subunit b